MRRAHTVAVDLATTQAEMQTRLRPLAALASPDSLDSASPPPSTLGSASAASQSRRRERPAPRQLDAVRDAAEPKSGMRPNRSMNDLRKAAVAQHVTQKDVVSVLAEMLNAVAQLNRRAQSAAPPRDKGSAVQDGNTVYHRPANSLVHATPGAHQLSIERFEGASEPKVSIEWYLWRLVYYLNRYPRVEETFFAEEAGTIPADFSPGRSISQTPRAEDADAVSRGLRALLLALVYIDRVCARHAEFVVTPRSLHRVMLTGILVATKFSDDLSLGTEAFARLGGIETREMAAMELAFCSLIDFELNVGPDEFDAKCIKNLGAAFDIAAQRNRGARSPSGDAQTVVADGNDGDQGRDAAAAAAAPARHVRALDGVCRSASDGAGRRRGASQLRKQQQVTSPGVFSSSSSSAESHSFGSSPDVS